jgi:uncharacterized protein YukE
MTTMGYDTGDMVIWSGDVDDASQSYQIESDSLFSAVDNMSAYYTGGLAETFQEEVLSKKSNFNNMAEAIAECAEVIKKQASNIDDAEDEMAHKARSGNILGD